MTTAKKTIADCIDREPSWIIAYAQEHLDLEDEAVTLKVERWEKTPSESQFQQGHAGSSIAKGADVSQPISDESERNGELPDQAPGHEETIGGDADEGEDADVATKRPKQRREYLKECFAHFMTGQGFVFSEISNIYTNLNGNIVRKAESPFQWVQCDESGRECARYWMVRGSIEEGVEIPSEVWNWPSPDGSRIYLIIVNEEDELKQYALDYLKEQVRSGRIELYAARLIVRAKGYLKSPK